MIPQFLPNGLEHHHSHTVFRTTSGTLGANECVKRKHPADNSLGNFDRLRLTEDFGKATDT